MTPREWADRLYSKTVEDPETGCWLWNAGKPPANGYPVWRGPLELTPEGKTRYAGAHRWSYILSVGPIPDGLEIDHLCFVRHCIRPEHLEVVTSAENKRRAQGRPRKKYKDRECAPDELAWVPVNVRAHLAARQIFHNRLAAVMGWNVARSHAKLRGASRWTLDEATVAADFIGVTLATLADPCPLLSERVSA